MDQGQNDELARLFAQHMQLTQEAQQQIMQAQQSEDFEHVLPTSAAEQKHESPVHFISNHYTGTSHIRPDMVSEPPHSPPPSYNLAVVPDAMADLLRSNLIDPFALLPNQVHLFQNANEEQRNRLLELWRIAPLVYSADDHSRGTWLSTSLEREENLAKTRYEQRLLAQRSQEEHMLDTFIPLPITPIRQAGEPAWPPAARMRAATISGSKPSLRLADAEPYIVNGYEADQGAKAVDPVYAAASGLWQAPSYAHAIEQHTSTEDQYGMFEQIRNHADWERLNERIASERMHGLHGPVDDDMEL